MLKFPTNDQFPEEVKDVREILMARLRGPPRHAVNEKKWHCKSVVLSADSLQNNVEDI